MGVRIVTDSTAYLPVEETVRNHGVEVVPLVVVIGDQDYREGVDVTAQQIAAALREHRQVSTARPSPHAFLDVYRRLAAEGADAIVSVHLSGGLSATVDGARWAAAEVDLPIEVVDTALVGVAMGHAALAAAAAARAGGLLPDVARAARRAARDTSVYFLVDSLDQLRRGGRLGTAAALIGTALAVKPILSLREGGVVVRERVRTRARAQARLVELAAQDIARLGGGQVVVQHLDQVETATAFAELVAETVPGVEVRLGDLGPVVGCHTGASVLGLSVLPPSDRFLGMRAD